MYYIGSNRTLMVQKLREHSLQSKLGIAKVKWKGNSDNKLEVTGYESQFR